MHQGSCHCGAVRLTLPGTPTVATDCNRSLCRRIGGPWVYFEFGTVTIEAAAGARHGVNLANVDPALIASVRVRRVDGADSWQFLDEQGRHRFAVATLPTPWCAQ